MAATLENIEMGTEASVRLRLTVWRDFQPRRALIYRNAGVDNHLNDVSQDLQQEIYSWQTKEDIFAGITDLVNRELLRQLLFSKFEPSQEPATRRISNLDDFIRVARDICLSGGSEWAISQDAPAEDDQNPYMINSLLAFLNQLEWLRSTFSGQPNVSVSIR